MIPGIMAGSPVAAAPASFTGVASAPSNGVNTSPLQYSAAQIDEIGAYSAGQNTRLTLAEAGLVRHLASMFQNGSTAGLASQKNGASFDGMGYMHGYTGGVSFAGANCWSAPLSLLAGDYLTTVKTAGNAPSDVSISWQAIEVLDPALKGAMVRRTTNQALNTVLQVVGWEQEVYDEAGYFNPAFPTRLTVPEDGLYRFTADGYINTGNWIWGQLRLNGVDLVRGTAMHSSRGSFLQMTTAPLQLVAGDYVEMLAANGASVPLNAHSLTWFAVEKVDPTIKRCMVRPTGQTVGTGNPAINFTEVYDPHGMFDSGVNAQRIYVPAECTQARLSFGLTCAWNGGKIEPRFGLNNAGGCGAVIPTSSEHALCALGAWVTVTPGMYAAATYYAASNRAIGTDNRNWLVMECR